MKTRSRLDPGWSWRGYALAATAILAAAILVLMVVGRSPWGAASGPGLWTADPSGPLTSQRLADPYTVTHVSHGLLFFLMLWWLARDRAPLGPRLLAAIAIESAWEILENTPLISERFSEETMAKGY